MTSLLVKVYFAVIVSLCVNCLEVSSQSNCTAFTDTVDVSGRLITGSDGAFLGIRVTWSQNETDCLASAVEVQLINSFNHLAPIILRHPINNSGITSAEFYQLDCHVRYTPKVLFAVSGTTLEVSGDSVLFGDNRNSAPGSKLSNICIGPSLDKGNYYYFSYVFNISWDVLPCHLQGGTPYYYYTNSYLIQWHRLSNNGTEDPASRSQIDTRYVKFLSRFQNGDRYGCLLPDIYFGRDAVNFTYSFQVAAVNHHYGTGPFSEAIVAEWDIEDQICVTDQEMSTVTGTDTYYTDASTKPSAVVVWIVTGVVAVTLPLFMGV